MARGRVWVVLALAFLGTGVQPSPAGPRLLIEPEVHELGQVVRGENVEVRFALSNAGDAVLRILKADPG